MTAPADLSESVPPATLAGHEPECHPWLADHECGTCGRLPGVEVIACSCGRVPPAAGLVTAGTTTVTLLSGPVVVLRSRSRS